MMLLRECHKVDTTEQGFLNAERIHPAVVTPGDTAAAWLSCSLSYGHPITFQHPPGPGALLVPHSYSITWDFLLR